MLQISFLLIFVYFIALPYEYENAITAVFSVSLTIVGIVLVTLCVLDAPWDDILQVWRKRKIAKEMKRNEAEANMPVENEQSRLPTKAQMLASEQEMLKRFRSALEQARRTPSSRVHY